METSFYKKDIYGPRTLMEWRLQRPAAVSYGDQILRSIHPRVALSRYLVVKSREIRIACANIAFRTGDRRGKFVWVAGYCSPTATDRRRAAAADFTDKAVITPSRAHTSLRWAAHASNSRGLLQNVRSSGCAWSWKNKGTDERIGWVSDCLLGKLCLESSCTKNELIRKLKYQ